MTLPDTPELTGYANEAVALARKLVQHLTKVGQYPWIPKMGGVSTSPFKLDKVSATLDFLVSSEGEVLFLEAGPPFGAGAHPCSVMEQPITGYARGLQDGTPLY